MNATLRDVTSCTFTNERVVNRGIAHAGRDQHHDVAFLRPRAIARVNVERPDQLARRQAQARRHLQSTEWGRGQLRLIQGHEVKARPPPIPAAARWAPWPLRVMRIVASILAVSLGMTVMGLVHHVYFDRSGPPPPG